MARTYTIRPLEWDDKELIEEFDSISAPTCFGNYRVEKTEDGFRWSYCFDEYYDEGYSECDSAEDGKAKAEAHWFERLSGCLLPVTRSKSNH